MAAHRDPGADCGDRPAATELSRIDRARGAGSRALPPARVRSQKARRHARAGLGFPHRDETQPVVHGFKKSGWQLEGGQRIVWYRSWGVLDIETINPTCVEWCVGTGFGVCDTVKGMFPGHVCI